MLGSILGWAVGIGRLLTGIWFVVSPNTPARSWQGSTSDPVLSLVRSVGGRDAVIGGGVMWALISGTNVVPWLVASVVADAFDFVLGWVDLEGVRRRRTLALAGGFAALGVAAIITNA